MVLKLVDVICMLCLLFTKQNLYLPERILMGVYSLRENSFMRQKKARSDQKQLSPTWGECLSAGKQQREWFTLLLSRQPGSTLHVPVCWVMETELLPGHKLAFPNFAEITLTEL